MPTHLALEYWGENWGKISFKEAAQLRAYRTAAGCNLELPINVTLRQDDHHAPAAVVRNLHCLVSVADTPRQFLLGVARSDTVLGGGVPDANHPTHLTLSLPLSALARVEKLRNGRAPIFNVVLGAEIALAVRPAGVDTSGTSPHLGPALLTAPVLVTGQTFEITYGRETWLSIVQELKIAETTLVEVPIPPTPPTPWKAVWDYFVEAREANERGGREAVKATVVAVREALKEWSVHDSPGSIPGWKAPSQQDRDARTLDDRVKLIRWHVQALANLGPHTPIDTIPPKTARMLYLIFAALLSHEEP